MLELAGAGSRAKIAEISRFWRSLFCTAGRSACLGYCAQQRGACGGLNVQRPTSNVQCSTSNSSTLARIAPPCILRRVFPHRAFAALVLLANGRDPHERFNLFGQPSHANTQRALADKLDEFFKRQADPKYDMWNSVRSKAGALK